MASDQATEHDPLTRLAAAAAHEITAAVVGLRNKGIACYLPSSITVAIGERSITVAFPQSTQSANCVSSLAAAPNRANGT